MMAPILDFREAYWQLSPMERKFVDGYINDLETVAEKSGQRLVIALQQPLPFELDMKSTAMLALPLIRAAIAERVKQLSNLYDISEYRVLKEMACIAYSNIQDYFDIHPITGEPELNLSKCTKEQLAAIKSVKVEHKPLGGMKQELTLWDKPAGLTVLMRHMGLLQDDNSHWKETSAVTKAVENKSQLPAGIDDAGAADAYAKVING